jgi:UDP-N-acetylmuramoyl-tripeptide--D-alanyl-D-alanine ligase
MSIENLYTKYLASTGITTDTRNIGPGSMFFALKGEKFNANHFAAEALDKGAAYAVVDEIVSADWSNKYSGQMILVDNVLAALQQLAGHHRAQLKCPVLAITGSNGKTTTKELTAAVLAKKFKTYATKGNLNNHIGVPLTILSIRNDVEFAVIEMGANHQGEIASYCQYTDPGYGLITNVGMAHTEGFGGFEGVIKGKTELYHYIAAHHGKIFVNAGNGILFNKASELGLGVQSDSLVTYGTSEDAYCSGRIISGGETLSFAVNSSGGEVIIATNLVGEYNFENAMSAVCVGKYFGVPMPHIKQAIESYMPSNNRSQKINFGTNTIILDAYNANPASMMEALNNFSKIEAPAKSVILGEMMELGEYSKTEHEKVFQKANDMHLQKRVFVGAGFAFLKNKPGVTYFENTDDLKTWFRLNPFNNSYLLVKGSRKNELEKILKD